MAADSDDDEAPKVVEPAEDFLSYAALVPVERVNNRVKKRVCAEVRGNFSQNTTSVPPLNSLPVFSLLSLENQYTTARGCWRTAT